VFHVHLPDRSFWTAETRSELAVEELKVLLAARKKAKKTRTKPVWAARISIKHPHFSAASSLTRVFLKIDGGTPMSMLR